MSTTTVVKATNNSWGMRVQDIWDVNNDSNATTTKAENENESNNCDSMASKWQGGKKARWKKRKPNEVSTKVKRVRIAGKTLKAESQLHVEQLKWVTNKAARAGNIPYSSQWVACSLQRLGQIWHYMMYVCEYVHMCGVTTNAIALRVSRSESWLNAGTTISTCCRQQCKQLKAKSWRNGGN